MRVSLFLALLLAGPASPAGEAAPDGPSLERLYLEEPVGGHPPRAATFSPDGTWLAYLRREARDGPSSLHVLATASGDEARVVAADHPLLPRTEDDDVAGIASFVWSPAGDALALEAGDDLFLVPVPSGEMTRLTETDEPETNPRLSPDGRWLAFARGDDLVALRVRDGREVALTRGGETTRRRGRPDGVVCEELNLCSALWWSPGSDRVAFLEYDTSALERYPVVDWTERPPRITRQRYARAGTTDARVRLGVVRLRRPGTIRWLDAGVGDGYLARVAWAPGGDALIARRLDRAQERLTTVRVPLRGKPEPLLEETDPHWVNLTDDFAMLRDGSYVVSSEEDGWRHLYRHGRDGRRTHRLTKGTWMVTELEGVDEARGLAYFTGTRDGWLERHLYRVPLTGGDIERLTPEAGTHDVILAPGARHMLDAHSRAQRMTVSRLRRITGETVTTLNPEAATALDTVALPGHRFFTIPSDNGATLQAQLILPADFDPARRYPVIVYVYGGPHAQMVADRWDGTRARYLWHTLLTRRGYAVFTVDNRGSHGRGKAFETAIDRDLGRVELRDQLAGLSWLKHQPWVDTERLGIWGRSYGGFMVLYTLVHAPDAFRAAVAVAPVTDWTLYDTIYTHRYMGRPEDNPDGYRRSSAIENAARIRARLLLVHGNSDRNVHVDNSIRLVDAMVEAGVRFDFELYPRARHGLEGTRERYHLARRVLEFFLENL